MTVAGCESPADRAAAMAGFLAAAGWGGVAATPLAGDASFRRYYRLVDAGGARADGRAAAAGGCAPVSSRCRGCCAASGSARRRCTPRTPSAGLLLIEDFGDDTYTRLLAGGADEARALRARDRHAGRAAPGGCRGGPPGAAAL